MRRATRFGIVFAAVVALPVAGVGCMTCMPGSSYRGTLAAMKPQTAELSERLARHVKVLAGEIGSRHLGRLESLRRAERYIAGELGAAGYGVAAEAFTVDGVEVRNLVAERGGAGRAGEIVLVGAHYDTVPTTPGADDNASGIAAMLELARAFSGRSASRTVRFVAFVNEEPPYFQGEGMGSWVYARRARARGDRVVGMLPLETVGYYRDAPGSPKYPPPFSLFYPNRGDFIAFVGNLASRCLVRRCVGLFRAKAGFPAEGLTAPGFVTGVGWSDHWSFWKEGYPAVMVTDTAPFRNPNYHQPTDTPDTLDYPRMARVVAGLEVVVAALAAGD